MGAGEQELLKAVEGLVQGLEERLMSEIQAVKEGQVRLERTGGDNTESLSRIARAVTPLPGHLRPRELKSGERHAGLGGSAPAPRLPTLGWLPAALCMRPAPRAACEC